MTEPLRQTGVVSYRRFVVSTFVAAFRAAFDSNYAREREFTGLKVTSKYPLQKVDYPSLVIEFIDRRVSNAGVGHEEWFMDAQQILRKWHHSRFEGSLNLDIYALSPVSRDLLADAVMEVIRFGRLESQLLQFFNTIYPDPGFPLSQIMLNSDELDGRGNSATPAPWQPEDALVYSTGYTLELHGGFYNRPVADRWDYVTKVNVDAYPQGDVQVIIPLAGEDPLSNPIDNVDYGTVTGSGRVRNVVDPHQLRVDIPGFAAAVATITDTGVFGPNEAIEFVAWVEGVGWQWDGGSGDLPGPGNSFDTLAAAIDNLTPADLTYVGDITVLGILTHVYASMPGTAVDEILFSGAYPDPTNSGWAAVSVADGGGYHS